MVLLAYWIKNVKKNGSSRSLAWTLFLFTFRLRNKLMLSCNERKKIPLNAVCISKSGVNIRKR